MRFYKGREEDRREFIAKDQDVFTVFDKERIWSTGR